MIASGARHFYLSVLLGLLIAELINASITNIYVNNLIDSVSNISACSSPQTTNCNLRSAWSTCAMLTSSVCYIHLPANAYLPIDSTLGGLSVLSNANISIIGNGAYLEPTTNSNWGVPLFYVSTSSVHNKAFIQLENLSIRKFGTLNVYGSVLSLNGFFRASLHSVSIEKIYANSGAIYAFGSSYSNSSLFVSNCMFRNNTAFGSGGGISIFRSVLTTISNSSFMNHVAMTGYGGAIFSNASQDSVSIENNSNFYYCRAKVTGACIYLERPKFGPMIAFRLMNLKLVNAASTMVYVIGSTYSHVFNVSVSNVTQGSGIQFYIADNTLVEYYSSAFIASGSGLFMEYITNTTIRHSHAAYNSRAGNGAGICTRYITNMTIYDVSFFSCKTTSFIGSSLQVSNGINVTIDRLKSERGYCTVGQGAAVYLYNVTNGLFSNSVVRDAVGNAATLGAACANVTFRNFSAINCKGTSTGGGISIGPSSVNITVDQSQFISNSAVTSGGAIFVNDQSVNVTILRSNFERNSAAIQGGAISINNNCVGIVVAGCVIRGNSAATFGGGIFVNQGSDRTTIQDYDAFKNSRIVQSSHPYFSKIPVNNVRYQIMNATILNPAATGFVISFDIKTSIWVTETLFIYSINTLGVQTLVYTSSSTSYPGVKRPAMFVPGQGLFFNFLGPTNSLSSVKSDYGFTAYVYPVMANPKYPTIVADNLASQHGGGVYIAFEQNNPIITNVQLSSNQAVTGDGGGMYMQLANVGLSLWQVDFTENWAGNNGGGVLLANGQFGTTFYNCSFTNSYAKASGGAMYLVSGNGNGIYSSKSANMVNVSSTTFFNNSAHGNGGGAVLLDTSNIIQFSDCLFQQNMAVTGNGGAISLLQYNDAALVRCYFAQNTAHGYGGAIYSTTQNKLAVQESKLADNLAGIGGGGISGTQSTVLKFCGPSKFVRNKAVSAAGGALLLSSMNFWTASTSCDFSNAVVTNRNKLTLNGNSAPRGSAVALYKIAFPGNSLGFGNILLNITDNVAAVGGTIYWVYDPVVMNTAPRGIQKLNATSWYNNYASYGNKSATQALSVLVPRSYLVTTYSSYLHPPINVTIYDYYGQFIPLNDTSTVYPSIVNSGPANCSGNFPYLTGPDVAGNGVTFKNGVAYFNSLSSYCAPLGDIVVQFEVRLGSKTQLFPTQSLESFYVSNTSIFSFRDCNIGEYRSDNLCIVCPQGSYNLDEMNALSCHKCIDAEGINTCYAATIEVHSGYWRRYGETEAVISCTMTGNCLGGNVTGDASCAVGYKGPLCGVCTDGYFFAENACRPCNGGSSSRLPLNVLAALLLVISVLILVGACAFYRYVYVPDNLLEVLVKENRPISTPQLIYLWCKMKYNVFVVKLKIIAANIQIVSSTASTFKITWPASFAAFNYSLGILNFNIGGIFSFGCSVHYDFFSRLLTVTMLPIVLVIIMCVVFLIQFSLLRYQQRREQLKQQQQHNSRAKFRWNKGWAAQFNALKNSYLTYIFYLTYFILPMVTTTIFQSFLCTNIDPQQENPGESSLYLTADLSISCETDYYYEWRAYAIVMIFVYPIGIPAFYFYLLYQQRHELLHRDDYLLPPSSTPSEPSAAGKPSGTKAEPQKSDDQQNPLHAKTSSKEGEVNPAAETTKKATKPPKEAKPKALSPEASRLSFLWLAYAPEFWYWEIVETTRRLLLTAALSVISPGSSAQNLMSLLLALLYVKLYGYFKPYMADADDVLAEIGQFQVFFTFFIALSIQNHMLSDTYNTMLSVLLIFMNIASVAVTFYQQIEDYKSDMKAISATKDGAAANSDGGNVNQAAVVTEALRERLSSRYRAQKIDVAPLRHIKQSKTKRISSEKQQKNKGDSDDDDSDDELDFDDDQQRDTDASARSSSSRFSNGSDDDDDDDDDDGTINFVAVYSGHSATTSSSEKKAMHVFQRAAQQHLQTPPSAPASAASSLPPAQLSPPHSHQDRDIEMAAFSSQTTASRGGASLGQSPSIGYKRNHVSAVSAAPASSAAITTSPTTAAAAAARTTTTAATTTATSVYATDILRQSLNQRNDLLIDSDDE